MCFLPTGKSCVFSFLNRWWGSLGGMIPLIPSGAFWSPFIHRLPQFWRFIDDHGTSGYPWRCCTPWVHSESVCDLRQIKDDETVYDICVSLVCFEYDDMIWYDMIWYDMIWYDMIWYDWYQSINMIVIIVMSMVMIPLIMIWDLWHYFPLFSVTYDIAFDLHMRSLLTR